MDEEDAQGILLEWMKVLAGIIGQGIAPVGGEIATEVTSTSGRSYSVEIVSADGDPGMVDLSGRIRESGTEGPVMTLVAEFPYTPPDAPGD